MEDIPDAYLEVLNASGKVVFAKTNLEHIGTQQIDLSNLATGIYFFTLRKDGKIIFYEKVVMK